MREDSHPKKRIQWLGFWLGPILACFCMWALPTEYQGSGSKSAPDAVTESTDAEGDQTQLNSRRREFSWAGRATLSVMVSCIQRCAQ